MAFNDKIILWILVLTSNWPTIGWSHHRWQCAGEKQSGPAVLLAPRTRTTPCSGVVMSILSTFGNVASVSPESHPRFAAESALEEMAATVRALRLGKAPFDVLSPAERADQLAEIFNHTNEFVPVSKFIAALSDDQLIELVADKSTPMVHLAAAATELRDRADAIPTPDERQRIESDDEQYHRELTLQREWESAEYQLDTPLHGRTFASFG